MNKTDQNRNEITFATKHYVSDSPFNHEGYYVHISSERHQILEKEFPLLTVTNRSVAKD